MRIPLRLVIPTSVFLALSFGAAAVPFAADDWPEWRGKGRLGVWLEDGILDTLPRDGLAVRWRTPIHAGYAGPAVAGGRVFVTDSRRIKANQAIERAVALDERTGAGSLDEGMADQLQRPAARLRDRSARDADRRRRSRLRARRDGQSARARRGERACHLGEGLRHATSMPRSRRGAWPARRSWTATA